MKITFLGATETVTGSKYLIETDELTVLVDCGLFQGLKDHRIRNWQPLPVDPRRIDALLLTHAHIDHSGYIPRLIKEGFRGKIYTSAATLDLCKILLPDCGYLQEEDARQANKYGYSKHKPALPLYTRDEAEASLASFESVEFGQSYPLGNDFSFNFHRAGHILGAAIITIKTENRSLVFSGDLGRPNDPIMRPPVFIDAADFLVVESTYGNRLHDRTDPLDEIADIVNATIQKGGSIIIPAFAVGRAQSLLYYLYQLKKVGRIPRHLPIYLDSPMSINATGLMCDHTNEHHLSKDECHGTCDVATYVKTTDESKRLNANNVPSVIISASGMATGGRILHHLKHHLPNWRNTVLLAGYQAEGTRGDRLLKGEKAIKIHGQMVPVNARIECLSNTSAHADYDEILSWLGHFRSAPKKVFITHGSQESAQSLAEKIKSRFGWNTCIPHYLQSENL